METTIKQIKRLFLLLCLVTAGVQSAWAGSEHWGNTRAEVKELTVGNVVYELCYTYDVTYYLLSYDFNTGAYTTNVWVKSNEQYYASAVRLNLSSDGPIVIENTITDAGVTYPVKYVGLHTEEQSVDKEVVYEWYEFLPTYIVHNDKVIVKQYKRIQSPTTINSTRIKSLTVKGNIEFKGDFTASSCQTAVFQGNVTFSNSMGLASATQITFNGGATISSNGTLYVTSMSELRFNKLVHEGKIYCPSLTDIYFSNSSSDYLPAYSGSFNNYFINCNGNDITCHMPQGTTESRIQQLKATAVFCDFKDIVAVKTSIPFTFANTNSDIIMQLVRLNNNTTFPAATSTSVIKVLNGAGNVSGTMEVGKNYAVVIRGVNPDAKQVKLKRNSIERTLEQTEYQGVPVLFFDEPNVSDHLNKIDYSVTVTDKTCNFTLTQTGYRGKITYTKTLNGTTSSGLIYTSEGSFTCAQGSTVKLSIPYDQYTPKILEVNGTPRTLTYENGRATASFGVPITEAGNVNVYATLTWQAPAQQPENHELPQVTVMRMGQGDVVLKDFFYTDDEQEMDYWRLDEPGWALRKIVNCEDAVTTSSISDLDGYGELLGEERWGFIVEATPLAGQTVKTFLLGRVPHGSNMMVWEDVMHNLTIDSSGKCTLDICSDYMNYGAGNYTVLVEMGPEETAVETGQTFNFVRKGGRGESWIFWEDTDYDFYFEEGSSSRTIPNEQLTDVQMHIVVKEGESFHVYKDGADITGQFQLNGSDDYWAELEKESATYTLLIEDAPNANPTWTIHNETEADVIVERTLKNGTTETDTYLGNLNDLTIDDSSVSKVTLKVYAENQNGSKPLRILRNGEDVSYMFTSKEEDGDGLRLCYDVPANVLTSCDWDISYDTSHRQTFVVNGGTVLLSGNVGNWNYEMINSDDFAYFSPDGTLTFDLPAYDSDNNSYMTLEFYVRADETFKAVRNGVDVTTKFTTIDGGNENNPLVIYTLEEENGDTQEAFGFQMRDPAVWQITIESPHYGLHAYATNDAYVGIKTSNGEGWDARQGNQHRWLGKDESVQVMFTPAYDGDVLKAIEWGWGEQIDLENDERLVKQDNSYIFTVTAAEVKQANDVYLYAIFEKPVSHEVTLVGSENNNVTFDYQDANGDHEESFSSNHGIFKTPVYGYNSYDTFMLDVDVKTGETLHVYCNGEEVTDGLNLISTATDGTKTYELYADDPETNYIMAEFDINVFEGCSWVILIDDGSGSFDLNHDGKVDIADVTKLVNKVLKRE